MLLPPLQYGKCSKYIEIAKIYLYWKYIMLFNLHSSIKNYFIVRISYIISHATIWVIDYR